jgi:hypothetical protein
LHGRKEGTQRVLESVLYAKERLENAKGGSKNGENAYSIRALAYPTTKE